MNCCPKMDMSELSFYEVVVVGSCNVELFCYADRLPKSDQTIVGTKFNISYGGKGGNMCVAAAKLGCTCALVARLGNDCFGKDYIARLKKLQIDATNVTLTDDTASGIAQITVTNNGANHVILIPNANSCLSSSDIDNAKCVFKNAKIGLFSCEIPGEVVLYALKIFKAQGGKTAIFVPFGETDKEAYKLANVVVLSISELASVTGDEITSITDARYSLKKLLKMGCETGVVTLGCRGALFMNRCHENPTRVFVTPVDRPVDTTGAGAAFVGALAFLMIHYEGMKFEDQVRIACEIARETVLKFSSQDSYPFRRQVAHLLPSDYC